jgi:hypothetical protein
MSFEPKSEDERPGRFVYSDGLVKELFANPVRGLDVLSESTGKYLESTRNVLERVPTGLKASTRKYSGNWYHQGAENTCSCWAIAQGCHIKGIKLPYQIMVDLLNTSVDIGGSVGNEGLSYGNANKIVQKDLNAGFQIVRCDQSLERAIHPLAESERIFNFKLLPDLPVGGAEDDKNNFRKVIVSNSMIIKQIIDEHRIILTGVTTKQYDPNSGSNALHAVCISGYNIRKTGEMDVQVIDPARGILWMSLEHLSKALIGYDTYTLEKT